MIVAVSTPLFGEQELLVTLIYIYDVPTGRYRPFMYETARSNAEVVPHWKPKSIFTGALVVGIVIVMVPVDGQSAEVPSGVVSSLNV